MFNNLYFELSKPELEHLKNYLSDIDLDYWHCYYDCPKFSRNIPIPTLQQNLILLFTRKEIHELTHLVSIKNKFNYSNISLDDIDYKLVLN